MSDIPKSLREKLKIEYTIYEPRCSANRSQNRWDDKIPVGAV